MEVLEIHIIPIPYLISNKQSSRVRASFLPSNMVLKSYDPIKQFFTTWKAINIHTVVIVGRYLPRSVMSSFVDILLKGI